MFHVSITTGTRYDEEEKTPLGLGFQLQIDGQIVATMNEREYQMLVKEVMRSMTNLMVNEQVQIGNGERECSTDEGKGK